MESHHPFLEKVRQKAELKDLDEARRATEVLFRTMRDVMSNEAVERVEEELDKNPASDEVEDLWEDTNPIVNFLSKIRPQLKIKPENFLVRLRQEGNLPGADAEKIIKAIFSATKEELSPERMQEIASFLPGEIAEMWEQA
ncbi:DUF2267 domain-containing protein [Trichocoleus sp. FACHB-90]|uniref:DUF2267 domain-containing protein n=1 Tax=Cyanophyceae TaxID=3028117 RepID=UPI00168908EE|nr:DUF2267 domain-containing protein [Trichocoleus sp. FACHB-90]MBD1925085.1 DUF2267 domain-containing protein [Trichocoleus sp. FACHB-90]